MERNEVAGGARIRQHLSEKNTHLPVDQLVDISDNDGALHIHQCK